MAMNTAPIYSAAPSISWGVIDTANTAKDGTGTVVPVFTADATNGGRVEKLRIKAKGTNVATVLRVWLNNGSTNATAANNTLLAEMTIAATTLSEVAQLAENELILNIALPAGYVLNVTIGTTVAAGLHVTAIGGRY